MNTIEHYVTEVIGEPHFEYEVWWVDVMADSYGWITTTRIYCRTEDEAKMVKVGYRFEA